MYTSFHMKAFPSYCTVRWPTVLSDDIPQLYFSFTSSESKSCQHFKPIIIKTRDKYYSLTKSIRLAVLAQALVFVFLEGPASISG